MKILADFHNVISHDPAHFKMLGTYCDLYVITGCTDPARLEKIRQSYLQFIPHKEFIYRKEAIDRNCDEFNADKNWRLGEINRIDPDDYYDDSSSVCHVALFRSKKIHVYTAGATYSEICWHEFDKPGHCKKCGEYLSWASEPAKN